MWYLKSKSRKLLTNNFCLQHREEFLSTSVWAADVDGWVVGDVVGEVAGDVDADDNADDEAEDWLEVAEVAWEDVGDVTGEVADEGAGDVEDAVIVTSPNWQMAPDPSISAVQELSEYWIALLNTKTRS